LSTSKRTWAEISISAALHNFNLFKSIAPSSKIMAVVKANAYGHSSAALAPIYEQNGADFFGVACIEEALKLRKIGITKPILILGYTDVNDVDLLSKNKISQCVPSLEYARLLSESAVKNGVNVNIHIKIDSGMCRLGFDCRDENLNGMDEVLKALKLPCLNFEGVFTHFAVADRDEETEDGFTDRQFNLFFKATEILSQKGYTAKYKHCCNSYGTINDEDKHLDMIRPGILLYGVGATKPVENLIPVMTLKSIVTMTKEILPEDTVGYGRTFKAKKKMKIATVAIGYADGYPRALSNKGYVLIDGKKANIVGRVCMDQICVDITDIKNVAIGDEVILFGRDLRVEELATLCDTISHELLCGISQRVPRIIKE